MLSDYHQSLAEFNKIPPAEVDAFPAERCSDAKQLLGSTWFRQDGILKPAAQTKGWNYRADAPVIDKAASGFFEENFKSKAELMKFLARAIANGVKKGRTVLMFAHENRFTRAKIGNGMDKLREMVKHGIYIYFASSDILLLPGWEHDAKILKHLTDAFDQARKEIESRQIYSLFSHKKKHADITAGVIVNTGNYPQWVMFVGKSNKHPGKYVQSTELVFPGTDNPLTKWDVMVRIKDEALAKKTRQETATGLNNDKIPCFLGGKKWRAGQILDHLRSKLLLGTATFGGTLTPDRKRHIKGTGEHKNLYPAVCELEEFNTIQHMLSLTAARPGPNILRGGVSTLFPRLAVCSACGGSVTIAAAYPPDNDGKNEYKLHPNRAYQCSNHKTDKTCSVKAGFPTEPFEEDFCGNYLQQDLTTLLSNQDDELRKLIYSQEQTIRALRNEIADFQTAMKIASSATAKNAVMVLLNKPAELLEKAESELNRLSALSTETNSTPQALNALQAIFRKIDLDPANLEIVRFGELAMETLRSQLTNLQARRAIVLKLPDIIGGIVFDLENKKYFIKNLRGVIVAERDLKVVLAARRKEIHRLRGQRIWQTRVANGTDKGFKVKNRSPKPPITEKTRAKLSEAHKASWEKRRKNGTATVSDEAKARMAEIQKALWKKRREEKTTNYAWEARRKNNTEEQLRSIHSKAAMKAWATRRKNGTDRGFKQKPSSRVWKPGEASAHVKKCWVARKKNLEAKNVGQALKARDQKEGPPMQPPPAQ